MQRIPTGITALDKVLQGGIPENSTILLAGRPGSGKTIFAQQMMFYNAGPDFKVIYLTTLAEPQIKVMRYQQDFDFFDMEKFQKSVVFYDLGYTLRRAGIAKAATAINNLLEEHNPKLIVIDTIKSLTDMVSSFTEFREFLLDLSVRMATWGCTVLMVGEYNEGEIEVRPEGSLADGIIMLSGMEERREQKRYLRILKMRGTDHPGGENYFKITNAGLQMFPRLNPVVTNQGYDYSDLRVSTGIPELDRITGGGYPLGSTTLLSGAAGTGKTILALHFAYAGLKKGEAVVYATFEENPNQIISTTKRLGIDLQPYIDNGTMQFLHISPIELNVDEHVYRIQHLVKACGAKRIIVDSISAFEVGMRDKVKYTDYIWSLTDYFKTQSLNVFLTHEMHDSGQVTELTKHGISYVADNLLLLRYLEAGNEVKRYLRVVKMRSSRHETDLRELVIGSTVSLGDPSGK